MQIEQRTPHDCYECSYDNVPEKRKRGLRDLGRSRPILCDAKPPTRHTEEQEARIGEDLDSEAKQLL